MTTDKLVERQKAFLENRKRAYEQVFQGLGPQFKEVLSDLKKFCRAEQTCFDPDARISAMLDGRREVWLRIQDHLILDSDELYDKYQNGGS